MKRNHSPNGLFPVGRRMSWLTRSLMTMLCLLVFLCGAVQAAEEEDTDPVEDASLGVASALLTLPYAPAKMIYAGLGGIVGGFTWVLTGGDTDAAKAVWEPSFYGTYVITPDHLRNDKPVRFFGKPSYEEHESLE